MSVELIAISAVGVALGHPLWAAMRDLRGDIGALAQDVGELRERMAWLEGLFEGCAGARPRKTAPA